MFKKYQGMIMGLVIGLILAGVGFSISNKPSQEVSQVETPQEEIEIDEVENDENENVEEVKEEEKVQEEPVEEKKETEGESLQVQEVKKEEPVKPVKQFTPKIDGYEFIEEYIIDPVAMNNTFQDEMIEITTLEFVGLQDPYTLILQPGYTPEVYDVMILLNIKPDQTGIASQLSIGDVIDIYGSCIGRENYHIEMADGEIMTVL